MFRVDATESFQRHAVHLCVCEWTGCIPYVVC